MERQNRSVKYGASSVESCLRTETGMGSAAEDLSGSRLMATRTSSIVTFSNAAHRLDVLGKTGGGA